MRFIGINSLESLIKTAGGLDLSMKRDAVKGRPSILVVRHAKTALNNDTDKTHDKIRGWIDVPLDAEGRKQAAEVAQQFKGIDVAEIWTSDLSRAVDTAQEIAKVTGAPLHKTVGLRPWNLGILQGKESAKAAKYLEDFVTDDASKPVPEGESFNSFKARMIDTVNQIVEKFKRVHKSIVIVTHYRDVKLLEAWVADGSGGYEIEESVFLTDDTPTGSIFSIIPGE